MSRVHDRDRLVAQLARELPATSIFEVTDLARSLMRAGATLQRLAEAQCNGDYPADNGERKTAQCQNCLASWVPSVLKRTVYMSEGGTGDHLLNQGKTGGRNYYRLECPDCRTQARVRKLLAHYGMTPIFNGDPRGAVFLVIPPSYAARNAGKDVHNLEGIYVS